MCIGSEIGRIAEAKRTVKFETDAHLLERISSKWPTGIVDWWRYGTCGAVITRCLPNAVKWDDERLSFKILVRAFRTVLAQLNDLHSLGYEHGDLVPKNIIVNLSGEAGLIDLEDATKNPNAEIDDYASILDAFLPVFFHLPEADRNQYPPEDVAELDKIHQRYQDVVFPALWQALKDQGIVLTAKTLSCSKFWTGFFAEVLKKQIHFIAARSQYSGTRSRATRSFSPKKHRIH